MGSTTTYDVVTRYSVDDRTKRGFLDMERGASRAAKSALTLGSALRAAAGIFVGGRLFGLAKSSFVDFNSGMEQARIQMAGLAKLNLGGSWAANMKHANALVAGLQQRAKKSVGTTKDMVDMASRVLRPLAAAGASWKSIEDVAANATVAARAFNIEGGQASLDIEQALMGTLGKKDRFARALLEPLGYTTEKWNAMSAKDRVKKLIKAMNSPAIIAMAKAQEHSWAGITSTLKDNLQIALGKVGLPLMERMTNQVKKWNDWIDKNPKKLEEYGKKFSDALVSGFNAVKGIVSFIVEHADLFTKIAEAVIVMKGLKLGAGILGGLKETWANGGGIPGISLGSLGKRKLFGMDVGKGIPLGKISILATAAYITGNIIKENLENAAGQERKQKIDHNVLAKTYATMMKLEAKGRHSQAAQMGKLFVQQARSMGLVYGHNKIHSDLAAAAETWRNTRSAGGKAWDFVTSFGSGAGGTIGDNKKRQIAEKLATKETYMFSAALSMGRYALQKEADQALQAQNFWHTTIMGKMMDQALESLNDPARRSKTNVDVKIGKVEVSAPDPDRFVQGMNDAIRRAAQNPTQARSALEGGF